MADRQQLANALRMLAIDSVQQANSGHPGMPMGMADIAQVLWQDFLQHNPKDPNWINRDRFLLSNGHGSVLQYGLLHLSGYDLPITELKAFRQLHSKTPGHPENGLTPGVEATTGPLGQGLAMGIGMAFAEKMLAQQFNRDKQAVIDHHTYVFAGDGCLMEGVSHEACSLAGTWKLGKLIVFWDDNQISIDGDTAGWFTTDTPARFKAYDWQVIEAVDGHNPEAIHQAIQQAHSDGSRPTLICCKTSIGYGSPNLVNTSSCHGSPLGEEEIKHVRDNLSWPHPPFHIPDEIYQAWDATTAGQERQQNWRGLFDNYQQQHPELAEELLRRCNQQLPTDFQKKTNEWITELTQTKPIATRKASQQCLNFFGPLLPELLGGSADLTGSNCTNWEQSVSRIGNAIEGNYIHYGVREFGMSAIMNGISLHHGFIPFGGTFLVFMDYARNAIRMSALMKQPVIYVFSHDSIGLGEDGPTHQPIEHINILRSTPNVHTWRPADLLETAAAWDTSLNQTQTPSCLLLSRQNLPALPHSAETRSNLNKGAYVLIGSENDELAIIATGSEVHLAVEAAETLKQQGISARVISMPCHEIFQQQTAEYQQTVLPDNITKRIAIEAGQRNFWYQYVGLNGKIIGIDCFGESAPAEQIYQTMNITSNAIIDAAN